MKIKQKCKIAQTIFVLFSTAILFCACNKPIQDELQQDAIPTIPAETDEIETASESEAEVTMYYSGILEEMTEDDLFAQSSLIALGTVSNISESFQVISTSETINNYTDYMFSIEKTYRGDAKSDTVTVRLEGGTVDGRTEVYTPTADLKVGETYLLFLFQPNFGGGCYLQGDYYMILGLPQGVFVTTDDGGFVSQMGTKISMQTLLDRAEEYPIDPMFFRNRFIENQRINLENGFISQEDYDNLMESLDTYAHIAMP